MMEDIENGVVQLLWDHFSGDPVTVNNWPETVAAYSHIKDQPIVYVMVDAVMGGEEKNFTNLVQETTVRVQVSIRALKLRGDYGIYDLVRRVKLATLGKRPLDGCGWLRLVQVQHNGENTSEFDYTMFLECPGLVLVENFDTAATGPALQNVITYENS